MKVPLTFADIRLRIKAVSFGTLTSETAWCVPAQTIFTQTPVHQTLINIWGKTQTAMGSLLTLAFDSWWYTLHFPRCWGHYKAVHLPIQFLPVRSTSKPSLQVHLYVLSIFSHTPFWQTSGSRAHSLISEKANIKLLNTIRVGKTLRNNIL